MDKMTEQLKWQEAKNTNMENKKKSNSSQEDNMENKEMELKDFDQMSVLLLMNPKLIWWTFKKDKWFGSDPLWASFVDVGQNFKRQRKTFWKKRAWRFFGVDNDDHDDCDDESDECDAH